MMFESVSIIVARVVQTSYGMQENNDKAHIWSAPIYNYNNFYSRCLKQKFGTGYKR